MNRILICFCTFAILGMFPACASVDRKDQVTGVQFETSNVASAANAAFERPPDEATVEAIETHQKVLGSRFEDLRDLPMPEVVFVFESGRKELKDLSESANQIVNEHWKMALRRFYEAEFRPAEGADEQVLRDREWSRICSKTQERLMETTIDSPGGRRNISYSESVETYALINQLALSVVREARTLHDTPSKI